MLRKCGNNNDTPVIPDDDIVVVDTTDTDSTNNNYVAPADTVIIPPTDEKKKKKKKKKGKITLNLGNKPGSEEKPWLWGNKTFYNTHSWRPFSLSSSGSYSNDLTEPNWFIQLQYEFKKDTYFGLHINKEKFKPNINEFGFGGPTDLGLSIGHSFDMFGTDWISTNFSLVAGATVGEPRFQTPWWESHYGTQEIYSDKSISIAGYERIGMFSTLVSRIDFAIPPSKRFNVFVATTLNYRWIDNYNTNIGVQNTGDIYSFGINVGLGVKFNYKEKKKPMFL